MTTKQKEADLKLYIREKWKEIANLVPIIMLYQIEYVDECDNGHGGSMSIEYSPNMLEAKLNIFRIIFKEMPDTGMTDGFKMWLDRNLGHEAAHCYLWELEGRDTDIEKLCTMIGSHLV